MDIEFPGKQGQQLSAVLILNGPTTGYALAFIEASLISATRIDALAAEHIYRNPFKGISA